MHDETVNRTINMLVVNTLVIVNSRYFNTIEYSAIYMSLLNGLAGGIVYIESNTSLLEMAS
jgi:hypothetical protein